MLLTLGIGDGSGFLVEILHLIGVLSIQKLIWGLLSFSIVLYAFGGGGARPTVLLSAGSDCYPFSPHSLSIRLEVQELNDQEYEEMARIMGYDIAFSSIKRLRIKGF